MPEQSRRLAVVTGASSGIGLELAKQFARNGFDVIVAAEDERVLSAAAEISTDGVEARAVRTDLATAVGVRELYRAVVATGRPVDALALNAGVGVAGEFVDTSIEADENLISLNITSAVRLSKLLLPGMIERGEGKVLITASIASTMPGPYYATYAASKAFVLSFAEAVRNELRGTGVTVTALMPGPTDTTFFQRAGMRESRTAEGHKDAPADVARDGYDALMAGKDHVVAGATRNRV